MAGTSQWGGAQYTRARCPSTTAPHRPLPATQSELEELPADTKESDKKAEYDRANREVAILCNHQRTVPKAFTENFAKLESRASLLKQQVEELRAQSTAPKGTAIKLKSEDAKSGEKIKAELDADAKKLLAKVRARV